MIFYFFKTIKSEPTLRIHLYDARRNQYMLTEEVSSTGTNKTFFAYTTVGKRKRC